MITRKDTENSREAFGPGWLSEQERRRTRPAAKHPEEPLP